MLNDRRRRATDETGFIITVELIIVLSVLLVFFFILVYGLRYRGHNKVVVCDADGDVIGKAVGFDAATGAPIVVLRDPDNHQPVPLTVLPDRFTTITRVYYTNGTCTGAAGQVFLPEANNPAAPPRSVMDDLRCQTYAVGAGNILYRYDPMDCMLVPGGTVPINSVYDSQTNSCFVPCGLPPWAIDGLLAATDPPVVDLAATFDTNYGVNSCSFASGLTFTVTAPDAEDGP